MDVGIALAGLIANVTVGTTGVELIGQARPLTGRWAVFRHVSNVTLTAPALAAGRHRRMQYATACARGVRSVGEAAPKTFRLLRSGRGPCLPLAAIFLGGCGGGAGGSGHTTMPTPVAITSQPAHRSVQAGATATISVAASGAAAASHTMPATVLANDGARHHVAVSRAAACVNSNPALPSVIPAPVAPSMGTRPTDQTETTPAVASFTAAAAGVPTPVLQGQSSTDGGTTFADIAGAAAAYAVNRATDAVILIDEASNAAVAAGLIE